VVSGEEKNVRLKPGAGLSTPIRKVLAEMKVLVQDFMHNLNCKSCPGTFVAAKTLSQYIPLPESFANGRVSDCVAVNIQFTV